MDQQFKFLNSYSYFNYTLKQDIQDIHISCRLDACVFEGNIIQFYTGNLFNPICSLSIYMDKIINIVVEKISEKLDLISFSLQSHDIELYAHHE